MPCSEGLSLQEKVLNPVWIARRAQIVGSDSGRLWVKRKLSGECVQLGVFIQLLP